LIWTLDVISPVPTVQLRHPAIEGARYGHPSLGRGSGTVTDQALIHWVYDLITTPVICRALHAGRVRLSPFSRLSEALWSRSFAKS